MQHENYEEKMSQDSTASAKKNINDLDTFVDENQSEESTTKESRGEEGLQGSQAEGVSSGVNNGSESVSDLKTDKEAPQVKEVVDYKAKFLYLAAEMDNVRKRFEREKESLLRYGNENLLSDLTEVVDNFERITKSISEDTDPKVKNIYVGVNMVSKQFMDVLGKHGLAPVASLGKIFDPSLHEAVSSKEVEGKADNEIIEEYQKGYLLNGRLLRPSKVVVASKE